MRCKMALVCKQKYFLVYTLWFASQIEFSDWDWRDLNIISRTIAWFTNLMCFWSVPEVPIFQIITREVIFMAPRQPEHNFSSEDNLVGLTMISLIKSHGIFPVPLVTASHIVPEPPQSSGFQNLKLKQAAGKNYGSKKEHKWKFPDLSQTDKASGNSLHWEETKAWVKLT